MCNLHIEETELSQKRSKGIKNCKITYSVILSVLSNKTNLILGFSSPLTFLWLGVTTALQYKTMFFTLIIHTNWLGYYEAVLDVISSHLKEKYQSNQS